MIKLNVPNMSCGHCAASITKAVKLLDAGAIVEIDTMLKTVSVTTAFSTEAVAGVLQSAGYPCSLAPLP